MSIHKLTAGSGYDYLTRQVAALDATEKGHTGLASYYTARGETPGVWIGSGMAGIDGLDAGDVVTADQMQALFGTGHHPLATQRTKELEQQAARESTMLTDADYRKAMGLGTPYRVYNNDVTDFQVEVAKRLAAINQADGLPGDWAVPAAARARVRTEVARDFFGAEHGREPIDARELAATIAKHSRPKTTAVAGFDLTFSPVKSVSVLWAVADPHTAAAIERAHHAAVKDALAFIEQKALFSREGTDGVRQVNVRGLVATAFTHRDSRAGDPDLHTHVAVANKVQTLSGKWLAIDGRILFKATVCASETYNTALEGHLTDALGVRFEERPTGVNDGDARKRPVREVVGVDPALNARFSKRRASVEDRRKVLAADFQRTHGRPPTPVETLQLAQQATLETREAKHEPRSLAEQRSAWHAEAVDVLGTAQHVEEMVRDTLSPRTAARSPADARWFGEAADRIVTAMEDRRATWQYWHVYAEAKRQVRAADVPTEQGDGLVTLLVAEVLEGRSVSLARPHDGIREPAELRRTDGSSVYTVAGADLFTSHSVLDAEQRLVEAAGRLDGHAVDEAQVTIALLESAANGVPLNAGQAALVREMATSGARLQLAIAPAGSGKTTAMRALAQAWTESGGTVIGLAPSAAAADALRTQIERQTDTLAKLVHTLTDPRGQAEPPAWFGDIGPQTLVVIDEAGMADTLSLDVVVQHVLACGGSVRFVGDDQQLAAIGAGGVLRDIAITHGALHLSELVRFLDPAEGAASLALREGRTEALGFYLDRDRIHVGDQTTMTTDVFASWQADRAAGLDSIMLAPTRELVSELNQQARAHRLAGLDPATLRDGAVRRLADGNDASVGELIITRSNDRRLRTSATDWVKNGDRWTVLAVHDDGGLTVRHTQHGRKVRLPAEYIDAATELGYACTIHTVQGVTADTMHGLATGTESRQQLYTMLTRGKVANHVYLEVVGDGDPHSVIHPSLVHPLTPTDILEQVLARDEAPTSATSLLRDQADPRLLLGAATTRYLDSLYLAAEHTLGPDVVHRLDTGVDQIVPGLSDESAWPTLRAHLLLLGAHGADPVTELRDAATERELTTAGDRAAVLDWRLDSSGLRNAGPGPLPWTPGIPARLKEDPRWGNYLAQRADLVATLSSQVRQQVTHQLAHGTRPAWAQNGLRPDETAVADVEVWRAAMQVPPTDQRPTGPAQLGKAAATWQRRLTRRVVGDHSPALKEWNHLLHEVAPQIRGDEFTPMLAERLAALSRSGLTAHQLLRTAAATGPLPDEHPAAALWWRMARHLTPAVATQVTNSHGVAAGWTDQLADVLGPDRVQQLQASPWWPALVANIDHALARGWQLESLLSGGSPSAGHEPDVDDCQALVWRTSIALSPIPDEHGTEDWFDPPPENLWEGVEPPSTTESTRELDDLQPETPAAREAPAEDPAATGTADAKDWEIELDLTIVAMARGDKIRLYDTDADVRRMLARADQWHASPVSRERMLQINELTQQFFETRFTSSWGSDYLANRFGVDLAGDPHYRPGQAPAGWTTLVNHLRRHGVTDDEMLATGVASLASTGRIIDRFRDRVTFPITDTNGEILGFVGRRHPDLTDTDQTNGRGGPKYLNTPDTPLFHKGAQLFGATDDLLADGATPVLVEGPMDAIAVTLASGGRYVGVAPLSTSLTDEQAAQLGGIGRDPIVATDADLAGQVAAERDFWLLTPHSLDPGHARFPDGMDPSDLLTLRGPAALTAALDAATPLGDLLLTERLDHLAPEAARRAAAKVIAARPPSAWDAGASRISARLRLSEMQTRRDLRDAVKDWITDPRPTAAEQLADSSQVHARLQAAAVQTPAERWATLASELDPRLFTQPDWPATAAILQDAHDQGHDVTAATRALVSERPLSDQPARDLRYRLVSSLDVTINTGEVTTHGVQGRAARNRQQQGQDRTRPHSGPRL